MEVTHQIVKRAELTNVQVESMHELLRDYFKGVTKLQFHRDLNEKNWVILLMRGSRLVGFSTLLVYETMFEGETVSVVYSGDTIVAPEAWRSMTLPRAWIASVIRLRKEFPRGRYYWLLLTSGFRTYRFLPVFWREFHPHVDAQTPLLRQRLLNQLAAERFGAQYDHLSGIVRFQRPQQLRDGFNEVPEGRTADPHVAFFLERNPGCVSGDELVCLTELTSSNLTAAGQRVVGNISF